MTDPIEPEAPADYSILFHDYAVAFVDLLGQQDELMQLAKRPRDPAVKQDVLRQLNRTALVVGGVRSMIRRILTSMSKGYPLETQQDERYSRFREQQFEFIGFSDSLVISVSLKPHDKFGYLKGAQGLYSMLDAIAITQLHSLSVGVPMRGGIDVEGGMRTFPGEIYGPVSINAYRIEHERAEYPRVVIGDGLIDYLAETERLAEATPEVTKLIRLHVKFCREVLCSAPDDGQIMLDFLTPKWRPPNYDRVHDMPEKAYAFVKGELARHRSRRDHKLEARYERLLCYFNARGFTD